MANPSVYIAVPRTGEVLRRIIGRGGCKVRELRELAGEGSFVQLYDGGDSGHAPFPFLPERAGQDVMIPGPKRWASSNKGATPYGVNVKSKAKFHVPDVVVGPLPLAYVKVSARDTDTLQRLYKLVWDAAMPTTRAAVLHLDSLDNIPLNYSDLGLLRILVGTGGKTIKAIAAIGGGDSHIAIRRYGDGNAHSFLINAPTIGAANAIRDALTAKIHNICERWNVDDETETETLPPFLGFDDLEVVDFDT